MSRLMLIPALIVLVSPAVAEEPSDSGAPLAVKIGPFELSARSLEVKARSPRPKADEIPLLNCSLSGDATIRIGDFVASADRVTVATDKKGHLELRLCGNCKLRVEDEEDLAAVADQIRLVDGHMLLLSGSSY